mgnify:FL=1
MSINIYVIPQRKDENSDWIVNRFCKKYRESNLYNEIRNNESFISQSEKNHVLKRKHQHLNDIYKKIRSGKLKPRNKDLYRQIMEN